MIELKEVVKSFDGFRALDGLSLHVPRGSVYGLVGPNGAGKTTAIKHIAGILRADSGEVLVDGEGVFENAAAKARLAYIPDDVFYFPQACVQDMMRFYRGIYRSFDSARFERLGRVFDIDPRRPIRRLSRGMQKQAAFWLAVSLRPQVLILDEPVDGLDPVMRRQVWAIIMQDVAENGLTVLISSHNLRELEDVCDRVGMISRGKLLLERGLSDLQDSICKIQIALPQGVVLPPDLDVLHCSGPGRLKTLIVRGSSEETEGRLAALEPVFMDSVPLTLEEIFIYELGGDDYAVKDFAL
ncbi:MAG TPA: ABC transporter ATP-binding protein [Candidatus Scatomorpha stercorigallinarum]|nr:ABC transporter ATP-binding protein [Candidatus Scatomorpha stercorigallinarum]